MIYAVAFAVTALSVLASALRLKFALAPTALSPEVLWRASSKGVGRAALGRAVAEEPGAAWERALVAALGEPSPQREALVNEQLTELDHLAQRWIRVPRVCASICTSAGFLLAASLLRASLAEPSEAIDAHAVDAAVLRAVDLAAMGLAGATFCVALQMRARKAAVATRQAYDRLVDRLEREASSGPIVGRSGAVDPL